MTGADGAPDGRTPHEPTRSRSPRGLRPCPQRRGDRPGANAKAAGEDSLAALLTSDGNTFDKNKNDFDILTEAALAVIAAKPDSPVALVADGSKRLTVFAPTDQAFRNLAKDLTGKNIKSEKKIFNALVTSPGWTRSSPSCSTTSSRARP